MSKKMKTVSEDGSMTLFAKLAHLLCRLSDRKVRPKQQSCAFGKTHTFADEFESAAISNASAAPCSSIGFIFATISCYREKVACEKLKDKSFCRIQIRQDDVKKNENWVGGRLDDPIC
jgi:hypothetical protein